MNHRPINVLEKAATSELAADREAAAADLEAAIAALGVAWRRYSNVTSILSGRVGADLARHLEGPIELHLGNSVPSTWLEHKRTGSVGELGVMAAEQHRRVGLAAPEDAA